MPALRLAISHPTPALEAGHSLLRGHGLLPGQIPAALEYVSSRLSSRALHATLVLIRHDYQLPPCACPSESGSGSRSSSPASSISLTASPPPSSSVRSGSSTPSMASPASPTPSAASMASAAGRVTAIRRRLIARSSGRSPALARDRLPGSPAAPPPTPPAPSPSPMGARAARPVDGMIRVIYAPLGSRKSETILRGLIRKAERKFRVAVEAIPLAPDPATALIIRNSLAQSAILFSAEGLTVLSLDRMYGFKTAVAAHERGVDSALQDAVDELHRLIVARGGCKLTRADVLRSYDWLGLTQGALVAAERAYRRAYGGPRSAGPFSGGGFEGWGGEALAGITPLPGTRPPLPPPPPLHHIPSGWPLAETIVSGIPAHSPGPLRIQTRFEDLPRPARSGGRDRVVGGPRRAEDRESHMQGPDTPNGSDDITPITKGEWRLLLQEGAGFGRRAAVGTC